MTTPLAAILKARIATTGPMSVADYMVECLLHPAHGYYASREPFGQRGDFITAPEISQLFGEIIGAFFINAWRQAGKPDPFVLTELGPGRGTLMADIVRTARIDPEFQGAAQIVLVEASERLRAIQAEALGPAVERTQWLETIDNLPPLPLFVVANEFFDALPIRQFINTANGWHERCVGLDKNGALAFIAGPTQLPQDSLPSGHETAPDGAIFELAPAREAAAAQIGAHLVTHGGMALLIDYGHIKTAIGDTFQAMRNHAYVDPLAEPGFADLTSHVDFAALARAAAVSGARALPPMTQGDFLLKAGIIERAGALGAKKDAETQQTIRTAVERLCGAQKGQMGDLFKALCLTGRGTTEPPPPFEGG